MGIIRAKFTEISAKSGKPAKGSIQVATSLPNIRKIRKSEIGSGNDKKEILTMDFDYETTYKPTDAKIVLKGELTFVAEDSKKIMELWEKEKKLEEKISLPILNYLLKFCAVECVKIADDLKLPVPVQLPEIRAKK